MQAKRKPTALLLSLCMLLGMLPMTAFCGGCTGCANKSEAGTDRNRLKKPAG